MPVSSGILRQLFQNRRLVLDGATGTELERRGAPTLLPLWSASALKTHPQVVEQIHRDYVAAGAEILVANTFRTNPRTLRRAGWLTEGEALNRLAVELARRATTTEIAKLPQEDNTTKVGEKLFSHQSRDRQGAEVAENPVVSGAPPLPDGRGSESKTAFPDTLLKTGAVVPPGLPPVLVAASVAPVEDCYCPERVPDAAALREEHGQMMAWLKAAGPDLVWIETMNTIREAVAAARAAAEAGFAFVVSFVTRESGELLSGETLVDAVAAVEPLEPLTFGLNCVPPRSLTALLPRLRQLTARPLAAYAHIGNPEPVHGWSFSQDVPPAEYAAYVRQWLAAGAMIVGGCCGTTPAHVRAVAEVVRNSE